MALTPVKSSNIQAVGYHAPSRTLTMQFKGGGKPHEFYEVPPEKYEGLMGDGKPGHSVGKYFHAHIKGAHKSKKLDE